LVEKISFASILEGVPQAQINIEELQNNKHQNFEAALVMAITADFAEFLNCCRDLIRDFKNAGEENYARSVANLQQLITFLVDQRYGKYLNLIEKEIRGFRDVLFQKLSPNWANLFDINTQREVELSRVRDEIMMSFARAYDTAKIENYDPYCGTGILNKTAWTRARERILSARQRQGGVCTQIFFDVDKFKDINDQYGQNAGDEIISQVALLVKKSLRDTDGVIMARLGGDEFSILLNENNDAGLSVANRARSLVEKQSFVVHDQNHIQHIIIGVTLSAGVATIVFSHDKEKRKEAEHYKEILEEASVTLDGQSNLAELVAKHLPHDRQGRIWGDSDFEIASGKGRNFVFSASWLNEVRTNEAIRIQNEAKEKRSQA